jgi:hypothetical protein
LGRDTDALAALSRAADSPDVFVRYLAFLIQGSTLIALDRRADAAQAFENAAKAVPGSQTPAVALAALNLSLNRPADPLKWAVAARTTSADGGVDPWWQYLQGDVRMLNEWIHEMRATS